MTHGNRIIFLAATLPQRHRCCSCCCCRYSFPLVDVFCARKYFDLFPPIARHVTLQVLDFHQLLLLLLLPLELHVDRSVVLIIIIVFDVVSIRKYYDDYFNTFTDFVHTTSYELWWPFCRWRSWKSLNFTLPSRSMSMRVWWIMCLYNVEFMSDKYSS